MLFIPLPGEARVAFVGVEKENLGDGERAERAQRGSRGSRIGPL
jgi:hypothetical protein